MATVRCDFTLEGGIEVTAAVAIVAPGIDWRRLDVEGVNELLGAPSRFESETLLRVLFADYGTKEQLLVTLERFAAELAETRKVLRGIAEEYVRGEGPFPERIHVNALFFKLVWDQATTQQRWLEWAIAQVEEWPAVTAPTQTAEAVETFGAALLDSPADS
jgi:hypothetical protein